MACPDETTIERFLAGALDEPTRRSVKAHLADCTPCCQLVGALVMSTAQKTASTSAPAPGARLHRYRIEEPLGAGGVGIVYRAYDPELDRHVALKVLWSASESLRREARAMAKLAHPNVVRVLDVGVDGERVFLAMELVEGTTLRAWLRDGPKPWQAVLERFRQAGAGLSAAHRAGLVHRDFKPENVLVKSDGTVLVTDFGLAHEVPFGEIASTLTKGVDAPGIAGTPPYMAPEQLRGEELDARADVYAFSVALWEAIYGVRPFAPNAEEGLLGAIAKGPVAPGAPDVPARVRDALVRGLSFRRRDRFASIEALLAAIDVEPPVPRSWTRHVRLAVFAVAVLAIGIVVGRSSSHATSTGEASLSSSSVAVVSSSVAVVWSSVPIVSTPLSAATSVAPVAPAVSSAKARPAPRRSSLRGTDFAPYGDAAMEAVAFARAHVSDFDACWTEGCVDITCRFDVDTTGRVTRAACSTWEGRPACPAVQSCAEQRLRALRFPAPAQAGECALFFGK